MFRDYLVQALQAIQSGKSDECIQFMSKAAEFGDDLTQFVDEVKRIGNTATRTSPGTSQTENTISPSLQISTASSTRFIDEAERLARQMAIASYVDEDDEVVEEQADESFAEDELEPFSEDYELGMEPDGFDEDAAIGPVQFK